MAALLNQDNADNNKNASINGFEDDMLMLFINPTTNEVHEEYRKLVQNYNECKEEKDYASWVIQVEKQIEENPFPLIPLCQTLRTIATKFKSTTTEHLADITFEKMLNKIPTIKYYLKHVLDFDDLLHKPNNVFHNFYDGGRGAELGTIKYMAEKTRRNGREVIVIDPPDRKRHDGLNKHYNNIINKLQGKKFRTDRIECVAKYVCTAMGGTNVNTNDVDNHIEKLRSSTNFSTLVGEVLLGSIELGVCRHRSILFKWLCDHPEINIPTRLIRGDLSDGGHAWNICLIDKQYFLVDVMNFSYTSTNQYSTLLIANNSNNAAAYKRTGGSLGLESVRGGLRGINSTKDLMPINYHRKNGDYIGDGTFGKVYKVRPKTNQNKSYALKEIEIANATQRNNALLEVKILQCVNHRNVVNLKASFEDETRDGANALYVLLELAEDSLQGKLDKHFNLKKLIDTKQVAKWLHHIALGMAFLHEENRKLGKVQRIFHRDLKPGNILICANNVAKITDFGVSKLLEESQQSQLMSTQGTPVFWSPELNNRNFTRGHKVDNWAFGGTIGYCLTNEWPHRSVEKMYSDNHFNIGNKFKHTITNQKIYNGLVNVFKSCVGNTSCGTKKKCEQNVKERKEFKEIEIQLRTILFDNIKRKKVNNNNSSSSSSSSGGGSVKKKKVQVDKKIAKDLYKKYRKEFPKGTPIVCACEKGRLEDVKVLITGYNDVNGSNGNNNNNNNMTLKEYVSQLGKSSDGREYTPLMKAAMYEHFQIVKYLIERGEADPNITGSYGRNALHYAANYNKKDTKLIEFLLTNMPLNSINKKTIYGDTPLDKAYLYNESPIQQKKIDLIRSKGGKRKSEL